MTDFKTIMGANLKALNEDGEGLAVIATLDVIDKDGDVIQAGAIGNQFAKMVPGHDWVHVPIGKAAIREEGNEVLAAFKLNLDIKAAREWHSSMLKDIASPPVLQEWSFGFSIKDVSFGEQDGQDVRFLKALEIHEISPVVKGAGINTRTVALKSEGERQSIKLVDHIAEALGGVKAVIARCVLIKKKRAEDGRDLSKDRQGDMEVVLKALGELRQIEMDMEALLLSEKKADQAMVDDLVSRRAVTMHNLRSLDL
ncbi:hypothetical protein LCGC14_1218830 [marine sediment metagenome]|uniref:Prohead serine protease domain-containing protein n=1 Tax=marine sediment metagenome TaxID=412755 RepID=A0A0F9NU57_9ZZZZ